MTASSAAPVLTAQIDRSHFDQQYQTHLKHLKLKGLQPKTIDAYSRAIRRIGARFDHQIVNGDPNPPLHGDALFLGMKNASRQKAQEPGQGQAAVFCGLA